VTLTPSQIACPLVAARARAREALLGARCQNGHWEGELSSSALSTATAVTALSIARRSAKSSYPDHSLIEGGLAWLAKHQNPEGGWGDTTRSISNISTTAICWAAFGSVPGADAQFSPNVSAGERWLSKNAGSTEPDQLAEAIIARYGKDRTFSVPILTMCALTGRLGQDPTAWKHVLPLPFELAALPHRFFAALRLPVVSYALPALIAIGQARHFHRPTLNPFVRSLRHLTKERALSVLEKIQPADGGFLEATPLTSFVTMSLAGSGQVNHPVTQRGLSFCGARRVRTAVGRSTQTWPLGSRHFRSMPSDPAARKGSLPASEDGFATGSWLSNLKSSTLHPCRSWSMGLDQLAWRSSDADDTAGRSWHCAPSVQLTSRFASPRAPASIGSSTCKTATAAFQLLPRVGRCHLTEAVRI
jgi:squalene-hopene/tetraprenyl-beta-curcumene cyclase